MENTETKTAKKTKVESFDIAQSDQTMNLAVDLAKFIKENKLYQNIQGKEFVNVEGWQYAGSRLGIFPVVEHLINTSSEAEMKYEAKVTLLNTRTGLTVGSGFAVCSNKENGKKYYQEFAIASMAQTRAIGKAFRNILAWIIRAAGYEPTPAEEMDYTATPEVKATPQPVAAKSTTTQQPTAKAAETKVVPVNSKPEMLQKDYDKALQYISEGDFDGLEEFTKAFNIPAEQGKILSKLIAEKKEALANPATELPPVNYATAKQKEEIIRLLNNTLITRQEKTKMLLNINKFDQERAGQSIEKLRKVIEEREKESANSAA